MKSLRRRVEALERAAPTSRPRWHCLRRHEDETDDDAVAAYEAANGPIGDGKVIMRVIIDKPGSRPLDMSGAIC